MTTFRVRAIPVGAAIQLSRRLLALGPRLTVASFHAELADWWSLGEISPAFARLASLHPVEFVIERLAERTGLNPC